MGQQSLGGFLGLHVDIDRISKDNGKKQGTRKYGTVLINMGDKMTPEEREVKKKRNQEEYGLTQEYIDFLKLPKKSDIKVYEIRKIMDSRKRLSVVEQIELVENINVALLKKLKIVESGKRIKDFDYVSP